MGVKSASRVCGAHLQDFLERQRNRPADPRCRAGDNRLSSLDDPHRAIAENPESAVANAAVVACRLIAYVLRRSARMSYAIFLRIKRLDAGNKIGADDLVVLELVDQGEVSPGDQAQKVGQSRGLATEQVVLDGITGYHHA